MRNREIIRKVSSIVRQHDGNIAKAARSIGVSKVYLWDVVHGNRKPGKKLKAAIGID